MDSKKLTECVRTSLGVNEETLKEKERWSIVPCAHNKFLDPEYDPIEDLAHTLLLQTIITTYNIQNGR